MNSDIAGGAERKAVTVVIPTLGGECLAETVRCLNAGSVIPDEILICIPETEAQKAAKALASNVKIIPTACRGQVAQRATGFERALNCYVMQLDDDIVLDRHCLANLLQVLQNCGPKAAVAPSLFCSSTRESFYKAPRSKLFLEIYYRILNGRSGYHPGNVTKAGTNVGIDPSVLKDEAVETDWLPGGCVLHHKKNLILENFYPFAGKAYCEDIIHSHYLRRSGVRLFVSGQAVCWVECVTVQAQAPAQFLRNLIADYRARRFFVRLTSRSFSRMLAYYVINFLRYAYLRTFSPAQ